VTGAAGRLGSRLVHRLLAAGAARVVAFDRRPVTAADPRMVTLAGDLVSADDVGRAVAGCDVVFHLAGFTSAARSIEEPSACLEANVLGTVVLLSACRAAGPRRVVFTSTSLVYRPSGGRPVAEDHPVEPRSPYAVSKLAAEAACAGYAAAFGLSVDVLRLANLYGAGDPPDTVLGRALAQARRGDVVSLRDLAPVRDFLHADDAVEGLIRVASAGDEPGCRVLNLSTGRGTSIREMAETLVGVVRDHGGRALELREEAPGAAPPADLVLDNARLRQRTGWVPVVTPAEGLARAWREALAFQR
jgi:nucleoside-diphosphate-sugar epimerase